MISVQCKRDFILHSTQAKLINQGVFLQIGLPNDELMQKRWTYSLGFTVLKCRNAQLLLWKHGCTHFPGFILRNIPNKFGFWNDVSKNIQIHRSILVLIIFMRAKVCVLYVGIWKGTYRNISYIFAFFSFISNSQRQGKKISLSHSFIIFLLV